MEKLPINPSEPVKGVHLYQALPALITHVLYADTVELQDGKIFYNIVNIMPFDFGCGISKAFSKIY